MSLFESHFLFHISVKFPLNAEQFRKRISRENCQLFNENQLYNLKCYSISYRLEPQLVNKATQRVGRFNTMSDHDVYFEIMFSLKQ